MSTPESQLRLRKTDQNPSADQNSLSSSSSPARAPIGSDYNYPHDPQLTPPPNQELFT
ncbi:hypothetical protein PGT21_028729 [Puccinia graminis f. sp. tritici]|uniref:Uncharacterized protein n=1 Tax=Puccinia graminis f. sp. tritici TaxID=56615 RepID=A0A5B0NKI8_PUCGR|nr:hypothetical protein PGT21_028729 [Puccinia graminis f. sp. tritici]